MATAKRTERTPGWVELEWKNVYILHHSEGAASDDLIVQLIAGLESFCQRHDKVGFCLVTGYQVRPPSSEGRAQLKRFFEQHKSTLQDAAIWIKAGDFALVASVLRSVATGIFMLSAPFLKANFVADEEEWIAWLSAFTGVTSTEALDFTKDLAR
jgi:hypothetical protein